MRGWLRAPLLHFLVGGAAVFALVRLSVEPAAAPIVVTADDVRRLRLEYTRETGLEPTAADEAALVDRAIEEELLFREALARRLDEHDRSVRHWLVEQMRVLSDDPSADAEHLYTRARALGLDRSDLVVRRILVQKMRLLAARAGERLPDDAELHAFYAEHRDAYRPPDRVSFWHVFLASAVHGAGTAAYAGEVLARLRSQASPPAEAVRLGDSFAASPHLVAQSRAQVEKLFGAEFAAAIERAGTGEWVGPVRSPYGVHLVWIEAREPGTPPALEAVRGRVVERWRDEQRKRRVHDLLGDLARRYLLHVESAAWRLRSTS
jgi:hypothetical protein